MRAKYAMKIIFAGMLMLAGAAGAHAEALKPYILGNTLTGNVSQVAGKIKTALKQQGFEIVGSYAPFPGAVVICATNRELKTAAAKAKNGGFGVAQRVAITEVDGKLQLSYVNPAYLGAAYGLGRLEGVSVKLKAALGAVQTFGSEKGIKEEKLRPGKYHYAFMMPYFNDIDLLKEHPDYKTAVDTVEKNLASGEGGTKKVYRIDLPGKEVSVFGVALLQGAIDGPDQGDKDTDREILDVVDYQELKHTAYLPYELMVIGNRVIALRGRYRIALHFPDTSMVGEHGFTKIMSAPLGVKVALEAVAGFKRDL